MVVFFLLFPLSHAIVSDKMVVTLLQKSVVHQMRDVIAEEGEAASDLLYSYVNNYFNGSDVLKLLVSGDASECLHDLDDARESFSSAISSGLHCLYGKERRCTSSEDRTWAVRLYDSWPKLESGILDKGPLFFLGDYDECASVSQYRPYDYCAVPMSVGGISEVSVPVTIGLCLPVSCINHVKSFERQSVIGSLNVSIGRWSCQSLQDKPPLLNIWWFLCVLMVPVVLGSLVEHLLFIRPSNVVHAKLQHALSDAASGGGEDGNESGVEGAPSVALTYRSVKGIGRRLRKRTVVMDLLRSFSIQSSLHHLVRVASKEMSCLHLMKVIVGHSCLFTLPYSDSLSLLVASLDDSVLGKTFLLSSSLAVDTFLFISGAVLAFSHRKRLLFRGGMVSIREDIRRCLLGVFHRISRVLPTMLLVVLSMTMLFNRLGDGPMWDPEGVFGSRCGNMSDVLPHIFFYSNFHPSLCLPWLWHVSLDFQLHLLCPMLLIGLGRAPLVTVVTALGLIMSSVVYRFCVIFFVGVPGSMAAGVTSISDLLNEAMRRQFVYLYANPLSRAPPFIIGVMSGWFVSVPASVDLTFTRRTSLKLFSILCFGYAFFAPNDDGSVFSLIHSSCHRAIWAVGLSILVWLCENGEWTWLAWFASFRGFLPVSRLSFGVFLSHEPLLMYFLFTSRRPFSPHSVLFFIILTILVFVLSLLTSFLLAVCVEIPPLMIEKSLLKRGIRRVVIDSTGIHLPPPVTFTEKTRTWVDTSSYHFETNSEDGTAEEHTAVEHSSVEHIADEASFSTTLLLPSRLGIPMEHADLQESEC